VARILLRPESLGRAVPEAKRYGRWTPSGACPLLSTRGSFVFEGVRRYLETGYLTHPLWVFLPSVLGGTIAVMGVAWLVTRGTNKGEQKVWVASVAVICMEFMAWLGRTT